MYMPLFNTRWLTWEAEKRGLLKDFLAVLFTFGKYWALSSPIVYNNDNCKAFIEQNTLYELKVLGPNRIIKTF